MASTAPAQMRCGVTACIPSGMAWTCGMVVSSWFRSVIDAVCDAARAASHLWSNERRPNRQPPRNKLTGLAVVWPAAAASGFQRPVEERQAHVHPVVDVRVIVVEFLVDVPDARGGEAP